jgi:DNA modification methylase
MKDKYKSFLEKKIVIAKDYGTEDLKSEIAPILLNHQHDIVKWSIAGGRRAIFASFGLGKTLMQLEIARKVIEITKKPFLIGMPLGVIGEFKDDLEMLDPSMKIQYITESDSITDYENVIYCTNYERIRKGDINPKMFGGVSFDEASCLRNLKTDTTNYVLNYFGDINYRFVATATPTPNDFIEILNYADYLGVIDRGHALTRFFQRDSTKAGNLKLYENKKEEFWKWVATWAVFINKPSDLGYNDEGYILPELKVIEHQVENLDKGGNVDKFGNPILFKETKNSLTDVHREKRESISVRVAKTLEIVNETPEDRFILWHHTEKEKEALKRSFKEFDLKSVYGSQKHSQKEDLLIKFKKGDFQILSTKPQIAGSGCNFQHSCHKMIFVGINYKFNDFIQAIHRCFRFKQTKQVEVHIIYTQNEYHVLKALKAKWRKHIELQTEMINLVREYGLNKDKIKSDMKRQMFENRRTAKIGGATLFNEDTVKIHQEMESNSTDMILTSIPFGDHYEYSDNYNDMGHNHGNENFFKQMEFLTPNLWRTLKPGKIAAIHVKDRIRYSYQNGTSFTGIDDFSGKTVAHFTKEYVKDAIKLKEVEIRTICKLLYKSEYSDEMSINDIEQKIGDKQELKMLFGDLETLKEDYKKRFYLIGKITVTTDVVRENNQTYRLGWSEQCKDATKMGVGLPEYILLFRKEPTDNNNAYADEKCSKTKEVYTRANWQLDAHAYWKSDGNRFLSSGELSQRDVKSICGYWKKHNKEEVYSFEEHLNICEILEGQEKLSSLFMTLPNHSNNDLVWTDINRMNTLNTNQANRKKQKHICPLQLDLISRLINRFTMKGDLIDDPFGGLFSTAYKALEMGRKAISTELNPEYYDDGLYYLKAIEYKINVPTLFDLV